MTTYKLEFTDENTLLLVADSEILQEWIYERPEMVKNDRYIKLDWKTKSFTEGSIIKNKMIFDEYNNQYEFDIINMTKTNVSFNYLGDVYTYYFKENTAKLKGTNDKIYLSNIFDEYTIGFGKYKGLTIHEIKEKDVNYLNWLLTIKIDKVLTSQIKNILK